MAPSADARTIAVVLATVTATALLAGCDSTFDKNARAKLAAQREVASRASHVVTARTPDVRAERVTLLQDRRSTAVVVELRNQSTRALTDLPITVGVRRGAEKVVLNRSAELGWFQTHVPSIAAGGTTTWIFRSPPGRGAKPGDEPFVRVGAQTAALSSKADALPVIEAKVEPEAEAPEPTTPDQPVEPERPAAKGFVRVVVTNPSDVPQLKFPVYVTAYDGDALVAAGTWLVDELPSGDHRSVDVPLTGAAETGTFKVIATPSIFF